MPVQHDGTLLLGSRSGFFSIPCEVSVEMQVCSPYFGCQTKPFPYPEHTSSPNKMQISGRQHTWQGPKTKGERVHSCSILQRTEQFACGPRQNSHLAVSTQCLRAKHLTGASKPRFSVKTCIMKTDLWDFPGSLVLTSPSNAGGMGLIAAPVTKIPHALRPKTKT